MPSVLRRTRSTPMASSRPSASSSSASRRATSFSEIPLPILARLAGLYERRGIKIVSGLNPTHFNDFPAAPFTAFFRDGVSVTNGLGIALQEIYFFECLFSRFRPRTLFAIGNSMGWSTLALGLLNPQARILAIDAGLDRNSLH